MELFSEIYSCYYNVVLHILNKARLNGISQNEMSDISEKYAFFESNLYIISKLLSGEWNLLKKKDSVYLSKIENDNIFPLTYLQKSWIKSLIYDERICLFINDYQIKEIKNILKDVEPLYRQDDFYYFDKYIEGDNYSDENYINNFRKVLKGLKEKKIIKIKFISSKNKTNEWNILPYKMEYSQKDDRFRCYSLIINDNKIVNNYTINICNIVSVSDSKEIYPNKDVINKFLNKKNNLGFINIEIFNERNAVERCMLHFASYEKHTQYDKEKQIYKSTIYYNKKDETELLIRVLSFGPVIKVTEPEHFLNLLKQRIKTQKAFFDII